MSVVLIVFTDMQDIKITPSPMFWDCKRETDL